MYCLKIQIKYIVLFLLLIVFTLFVSAQQNVINYSSQGNSLNVVLEEISATYHAKFAYDSDLFQQIRINLNLKNSTLEQFLELLETDYSVKSKFIEGTWVLVLKETEVTPIPEFNLKTEQPKPITIGGYVKDRVTGENLMYCNVVFGENKGAMTNNLGFFNFDIPESDSVRILISHLGYKRLDTLVSTNKTAILPLYPSEIMMEAIEVTQVEKKVLEASPQPDKIGFNPVKAANVPRISSDDLANALLLIPGVNFLQGNSSGLSIRGSSPADNLVLFDGIPVLETTHLLGNISVLNSKFVQQAFVSRGSFDAEFGGRIAGLVELIGKSGKNNNPYLDVSANLLNTNLLANVPITDKFSVTAAWRRSFIDQWQNYLFFRLIDDVPSENTGGNTVTSTLFPAIKYQDVNAKISFHPSDNFEINFNVLYGSDYQSRDYELMQTNDYYRNELMKSKNLGFSFNWNWQINNHWYQSLTAGYSNLEKKVVDETGELEEITEIIWNPGHGKGKKMAKTRMNTYTRLTYDIDNGSNNIEEYRVAWKNEYKTGIFRNQAGIGWTYNSFAYHFFANRTNAAYPIDSITNSSNKYLLNAFLQQHVQLTEEFKLRWGIRTNIDLISRKTYWQPRGGVEYTPVPELKFHFLSGIYNQFLSSVKRIDSEGHFNPVWYLPDENGEGVVRAVHYVLGTKYEKNGWMVNAESYWKDANGKMNLFAEAVTTGAENIIVYSPKKSREQSKGIDLFVQKKHKWVNHMVGFSASKTEEKIEGILNDNWFPAYNDRLFRLKLTEMVTWKNWSLTGSWNFGSGLPVVNLTENNSLQNIERTDYFSQLDFAVAKKFYTTHFSANAGVSLLNVFNRKNIVEVDYLRFTSNMGSLSVRSDISALAFTPVFFINFKLQ